MSDKREGDLRRFEDITARGNAAVDAIVNWNKPSFSRFISGLEHNLQYVGSLRWGAALDPDQLSVPQVVIDEDIAPLFLAGGKQITPAVIVYDASGIAHRDGQLTFSARGVETDKEKEKREKEERWAILFGSGRVGAPGERRDLLWLSVDGVVSVAESKQVKIPLMLVRRNGNISFQSDSSMFGEFPVGEHGNVEDVVVVAYGSESQEPLAFPLSPSKSWRTFVQSDGSFRDGPVPQPAVQETVQASTLVEQPQQSISGKPTGEAPRRRVSARDILGGDSLLAIEGLRRTFIEPLKLGESKTASSLPNSEIVIDRKDGTAVRHPATVRSSDIDVALEISLTQVAAMEFKKLCRGGAVSSDQLADALQTTSRHSLTDKVTVSVAHAGAKRVFLSAVFDHFDVGELKHRKDSTKISPEFVAALFDRLQKPEKRNSQGDRRDEKRSGRRSGQGLSPDRELSGVRVDQGFEDVGKERKIFDSIDLVTPRRQSGPKSSFERRAQQAARRKAGRGKK